MRRRRLLAALATVAVGTTAGCGYAYGGGDLREEGSIYTGGLGTTQYVLAGDRIVAANSGRIVDHDRGGFHDGTRVSVADLNGNVLWRHTHWEHSAAVAGTDPVHLLDEGGRIVALDASRSEDERDGVDRATADGEEQWRASVESAEAPLVADERGVYVAVDGGVAAVRDGEETWRAPLPGHVESLHVAGDTVLAATSGAVVALAASGQERWRRGATDAAHLAATGDRVAIHDGDGITVVDVEDGDRSWSTGTGGLPPRMMAGDGRLYVVHRGALRVFDADTGDREWRLDAHTGLQLPLVDAPEGAYVVDSGCRVLALDGEGRRWSRELSVQRCDVVGGWLDGERVAFLFESGDLRWLQRTGQDPGLL